MGRASGIMTDEMNGCCTWCRKLHIWTLTAAVTCRKWCSEWVRRIKLNTALTRTSPLTSSLYARGSSSLLEQGPVDGWVIGLRFTLTHFALNAVKNAIPGSHSSWFYCDTSCVVSSATLCTRFTIICYCHSALCMLHSWTVSKRRSMSSDFFLFV